MCNPIKADKSDALKTSKYQQSKVVGNDNVELVRQQENLRKSVIYGSISTALAIGGFAIFMPYLQSRRDELDCGPLCQGSMTSARSLLKLIGSVLMGRLSDGLIGRKMCLYIGSLGSVIDFVILGMTFSIRGLWWSSVFGSLLQHNFGILKAIIADCYEQIDNCKVDVLLKSTSSAVRASSIGKIGMSVGLAFMIGPLIGGIFVKSFESAILLGMFFLLLSIVFISKIPDDIVKKKKIEHNENLTQSPKTKILSDFLKIKAARSPSAIFFMVIRTAMGLAFHIFNTVWTVSLKTRFQFGPADYGRFFSFIGLGFALSQGFLAGYLVRLFGPKRRVLLILICSITLGLGRWVAFHTQSLVFVYFTFSFIITALGVMNTIITVDTSKIASSEEVGGLMGLLDAVQNAAGMVGPIIGGVLGNISWGKENEDAPNTNAPLLAVVSLYAFIFFLVLLGYDKYVVQEEKRRKALHDTSSKSSDNNVTFGEKVE